jgi:hypothetical protein
MGWAVHARLDDVGTRRPAIPLPTAAGGYLAAFRAHIEGTAEDQSRARRAARTNRTQREAGVRFSGGSIGGRPYERTIIRISSLADLLRGSWFGPLRVWWRCRYWGASLHVLPREVDRVEHVFVAFRYLLSSPTGHYLGEYVVARPDWSEGDTFTDKEGRRFRIVSIDRPGCWARFARRGRWRTLTCERARSAPTNPVFCLANVTPMGPEARDEPSRWGHF